ncbi:sodium-dependent transporter [Pusillimonas sp. CC-YST705]|uniref:Sodium-dependent transporter n=1 Tax=Mesopusillimonas faecipullorum TaxID=2755040 RepID=A0ABS8CDN9_9BURK|nr:sodium-dependent transporter [Mesopusillimonas faecipullorum]MCB5363714.1 sodium-dependent transporter [Mesopusillimonas faecipullorum]
MERTRWSSSLGFVLAATGSAVGLGAIWKFPYVVAHQGGGAFLLLYTALTLSIGLGLLRVEMAIGRAADAGAYGAFLRLGGRLWSLVGALAVLASAVILSYYSVVGGWTLAYFWQVITEPLARDGGQWTTRFAQLSGSGWAAFFYHGLFMLATLTCVAAGVQKGIERLSKVLMPCLFVMMCILIVRGLMLPGAWEGVLRFLMPNLNALDGTALLSALGLSFWTLSLAMGVMVTYGSYLPSGVNLGKAARMVALLTMLSCVLSGLLVLPPAHALGLGDSAGPGLTFVTMPLVFAELPWGNAFGAVFFALLFIAALTSSISILEVPVAFLIETLKWPRRAASACVAGACYALGIAASLSFGERPTLQLAGKSVFGWLDYLASNVFLPVGGVLTCLFAAWWVWPRLREQWGASGKAGPFEWVKRIVIGVFAPAAMLWILWQGLAA